MLSTARSYPCCSAPPLSTCRQPPSCSRTSRCLVSNSMTDSQSRDVTFHNKNGQTLAGILTSSDQAQKSHGKTPKCVILCHGYASHKNGFQLQALAAALANAGFNSLRFDFCGNGDSEGTFRLSGYTDEADDIQAAKQYLEQQEGQQVVALLGHSKGGDDVIIYAGTYDDIPLVINVAGRFWMADGLKQRFGEDVFDRIQQGPVTLTATRDDGHTFDWTLTLEDLLERATLDMSTYTSAIKSSKVLTIHGTADSVISVQDGKEFHSRIPGSELVLVPDADHNFRNAGTTQPMIDAVVRYIRQNS